MFYDLLYVLSDLYSYSVKTIKCDLDKGFWNKPTPQCIPAPTKPPKTKPPKTTSKPKPPPKPTPSVWNPMKHNKCKPPKPPVVGHWVCKTQMINHDRSESFESSIDHEGLVYLYRYRCTSLIKK